MNIAFTKMHGLGNDFMVINLTTQSLSLDPQTIRRWSDRHLGIGFDQLLVVEKSDSQLTDFRFRIFNANGEEVEQCGNGARCFARYVHDKGLTDKTQIQVETLSGPMVLTIQYNQDITVDMGPPRFTPAQIPFLADQTEISYPLTVNGQTIAISALSMGNPHAVMQVDSAELAPVSALGPLIEQHPRFPKGTNVGFMEILNEHQIRLRVFERGIGETLACGSGACAAAVAAMIRSLVKKKVNVDLPGGRLVVSWAGIGEPVYMTGPASTVFEGNITL